MVSARLGIRASFFCSPGGTRGCQQDMALETKNWESESWVSSGWYLASLSYSIQEAGGCSGKVSV